MHLPRAHFIRKEGGVPSGLNMRKKKLTNATLYKSNRNRVTVQVKLRVTKRLFSP